MMDRKLKKKNLALPMDSLKSTSLVLFKQDRKERKRNGREGRREEERERETERE